MQDTITMSISVIVKLQYDTRNFHAQTNLEKTSLRSSILPLSRPRGHGSLCHLSVQVLAGILRCVSLSLPVLAASEV